LRIIAVANQKGGCGKTTTSINLAACLAFLQKKVLLIDLDPQGHSTCGLGVDASKIPFSLYDYLQLRKDLHPDLSDGLIELNPYFSLLPGSGILNRLEGELMQHPAREWQLKKLVGSDMKDRYRFDFVIIDCPPNLGLLTLNALLAAHEILVPVEPSFFSLHGLAKISETIQQINQRREAPIDVHALITLFNSETCLAQEVFHEVKAHFHHKLFKAIIHENVALKEAVGAGQSIVQYAPNSTAFQDYMNLAVEYLEREWDRLLPEKDLGWGNILKQRFGPRRVVGGILFQVPDTSLRSVEIAGDFNNWIPEQLVLNPGDGIWQIVIPIIKGTFRYKFIVDGEWQLDPFHPAQKENSYGTYDSFLEIA